jgi:nucleotide-binding universal stress UspA family protein
MSAQTISKDQDTETLPVYQSILIAVDSSDYSNRGQQDALIIASPWQAHVTGTHVYAAKLHDNRFRQMEGGLPEPFRVEQELERQRDVHDELITRGLTIITDSYLDQTEHDCEHAGIDFQRLALEGKNYRALVTETNTGNYDLLVMGALGLGAIQGSRLGTVCQRVSRRSTIDTLVIKDPNRSIIDGPIVVAVDGSAKANGGLLTALSLAREWNVPLHIISAFDPYFHYVAFNRIAEVLSEEAGKVFRFKQQEKLHEEIIDSGLAKIYQGHLDVAASIAEDYAIEVETKLLDGKPHDAIEKYLHKVRPSLLVIGKTGIHADADLDIGGNAELLLHNVDCAVLLSQREHQPRVELIAEVTTSWTVEAEQRMTRVPDFVQNMARMAILRYAQQRGHTIITASIVDEATAQLMPGHAEQAMQQIVEAYDAGELAGNTSKQNSKGFETIPWQAEAETLLNQVTDPTLRENLRRRAEKKARAANAPMVETEHIRYFIDTSSEKDDGVSLTPRPSSLYYWQAAALARLMRVPEGFMRDSSRQQVEEYANKNQLQDISLEVCEAGLAEARKAMEISMLDDTQLNDSQLHNSRATPIEAKPATSKCPFASLAKKKKSSSQHNINWNEAAEQRMLKIPAGFMRDLTRQRVEAFARRQGINTITTKLIEDKYKEWGQGSDKQQSQMDWDASARERLQRIPDFVRGMVMLEVERCARDLGQTTVTTQAITRAGKAWQQDGGFHSESHPDQYKDDYGE